YVPHASLSPSLAEGPEAAAGPSSLCCLWRFHIKPLSAGAESLLRFRQLLGRAVGVGPALRRLVAQNLGRALGLPRRLLGRARLGVERAGGRAQPREPLLGGLRHLVAPTYGGRGLDRLERAEADGV